MKKKLCAALAAMVFFLFFGCSSGGTDGPGEIPQNPGINQGGEQKPDQGGESGGGEGENPGDGESEEGENNTPSETIANDEDVIKLVIGETEYTKIAGNVSSGNLTLTAQTIKKVGDTFSGLSNYKGKEKKIDNIALEDQTFISNNKEVLVAQDKGLINIAKSGTKYFLNSYSIPVKFSGEFNLSEISLPTNNGNGDFANATLTNNGEGISIDKLNTIRGTSLPTLIFANVGRSGLTIASLGDYAYKLYKDYSDNLTKLEISADPSANFSGIAAKVNGKKISGDSNYTLLENDGNTVKKSSDPSIKSLPLDALIQMYKQLGISKFINMIISGDAKEVINVDWRLNNIVFEGDMSKIKNTGDYDLAGIVYFKDKAYNNNDQEVLGLLKLDKLDGISSSTFGIRLFNASAVLDVRGVDTGVINAYDRGNILTGSGYAHAIYFSDDFSNIKDDQEKINALSDKFSEGRQAKFIHVYLGNNQVKGPSYKSSEGTYGSPRTLKDFEFFGNNYEDNTVYKFENGDEFALNNKMIEFIDPETQKIIFSLVNDRQYNS